MKHGKYIIRCDMEGASGIVSYDQADPSKPEYKDGRKWFMSDLNAAINGLRAGGAGEIHVYDEHFFGRNIDISALDDKDVFLYAGKPPYTENRAGGLDDSFDGLILLGFHSKRGTENALLNHSYEPDIRDIRINGVSVGEIGVEAAIAGDFGVKTVMITADSEGVREARELIGENIRAVTVKESLSESGALCHPLEKTRKMIFDAAKETAEKTPDVDVYRAGGDVRFEFTFFDTPYARTYDEMYGSRSICGKSAVECWSEYWQRKLKVGGIL